VTYSLVVIHIIYSQLITEVTHDSIEGRTAMNDFSGHHDNRYNSIRTTIYTLQISQHMEG